MDVTFSIDQLLSVSMAIAMVIIAVAGRTTVQAATESTSKELGAIYLNTTSKYLHLGREESNSFDFDIKDSKLDKDATYFWYVKEDKGNPNAVTIDASTGVVQAKEAGKAYIRVKITLADKTVLRPEAQVTVRNNITEVDINNIPENQTLTANSSMDFNRDILNTEAGKDKAASGITRWELAEDNAGVKEVSDKGVLTPTEEGTFNIRTVSFQSKEKYGLWLTDKVANANYVTAASEWYEVTVASALTDTELATEAIKGLFVDADAPNDEKALAEDVTQEQIDAATTLVDKLTDENTKIFGHAVIAMAQGLYDEKLTNEEAANVENALKALEGLFVDISVPNDEKALAEGVTQMQLDEATALVNKLTDGNSKVFGHAVIALAQGLLDEKLANEANTAMIEDAIKALEDLFIDGKLAEGVDQAKIDETTELVNKAIAKAQGLL
ncbi:MAG TPA: toxin Cry1Ac domain D-VI-related protein, partial [Mobilitalea sp.]|nr:toxin Cry1Ac domain D-VI-related protein [Mobilitalea sp.]